MSKENKSNSTSKKKQDKVTKIDEEKETKVTKKKNEPKKEDSSNKKKESKQGKLTKEKNLIEEEESFDDEFLYEDDIIEEEKTTTIKKKKEKKSDDNSEEKIQKIEKIAKQKNKTSKHKNNLFNNFLAYLDQNRFTIYGFIGGVLLTILVVIIIWPDRIATLKDGTQNVATIDGHNYTANDLYENMKDYYSVNLLLDQIDNDLLTSLYEENDEMMEEVNSNAEYYLNMYEQYYGYTEEQFLSENGFSNYDAFLEYLKLDYRRNKYLEDYIKENIKDSEIDDYYKENVFGDINCQHILVEVSSSDDDGKLSDDDAKALAQEIIDKLNDGTSWEDVQKEYEDQITFEDLGYQAWNASLEDTFISALKDLDDNSYSTEPVQTSYGYHVIYRLDQKDAPELDDVKDDIIDNIVTEKQSEDSDLLYKALINLRKEKNLEFTDTVLGSKYDAYVKKYN